MLTMAVGQSDDVDPADAVAAAIDACRAGLGGAVPTAALLISAFDSFEPSIVAAVRAAFPGIHVAGATSAAEMSSAGGYLEDSITLAVFASDTVDITVGLGGGLGSDAEAACRAAVAEALAATAREPRICVVLADAFAIDAPTMLEMVARIVPAGVEVVGGASARIDLGTTVPTYQFCDDRVVEDGIAVLLFSGPVRASVAVGTGWTPIGPLGTVTATDGGDITRIDDQPAAAFFARYLDSAGPAAFGNPVAVYEAGIDRPYLRVLLRSDPETGRVALLGSVPVGARIRLTTTDPERILEGVSDSLGLAREAFPAGRGPEAALLFSCSVRKFLLGSRTGQEADRVREMLGPDLPFAGLYCHGEIGPVVVGTTPRFQNETFVTLLLGT